MAHRLYKLGAILKPCVITVKDNIAISEAKITQHLNFLRSRHVVITHTKDQKRTPNVTVLGCDEENKNPQLLGPFKVLSLT